MNPRSMKRLTLLINKAKRLQSQSMVQKQTDAEQRWRGGGWMGGGTTVVIGADPYHDSVSLSHMFAFFIFFSSSSSVSRRGVLQ